ncbi:hypothetical protein MGH68_07100 [Erysipelothrix sp. D19-032]
MPASNVDGVDGSSLSIDTEYLLENLDVFNKSFNTSFRQELNEEELIEFFSNAYFEILSENMFESTDPKVLFNNRFTGFATFE